MTGRKKAVPSLLRKPCRGPAWPLESSFSSFMDFSSWRAGDKFSKASRTSGTQKFLIVLVNLTARMSGTALSTVPNRPARWVRSHGAWPWPTISSAHLGWISFMKSRALHLSARHAAQLELPITGQLGLKKLRDFNPRKVLANETPWPWAAIRALPSRRSFRKSGLRWFALAWARLAEAFFRCIASRKFFRRR